MTRATSALLLAVAATAVVLTGCDPSFTRAVPDRPSDMAAVSILDPSSSRQGVLLMDVSDPRPGEGNTDLIDSATITINGVDLANRTADSLDDEGILPERANYRTSALDVKPGTRYRLDAQDGDRQLSGTVAVPDTFVGFARGRRLVWTKSRGAQRYRVTVEGSQTFEYYTSDTTVFVGPPSDSLPAAEYYVEVAAQDSNLTTFLQTDIDRAGISGGYGLFGAQTRIVGTVTLSRAPRSSRSARTSGSEELTVRRAALRSTDSFPVLSGRASFYNMIASRPR